MITSMALVAALTFGPGQGGLTLSNPRVTYGELGAVRADNKFLPGDIFFLAYDIDGMKIDETGRVKYSMAMNVVDADNKPIFKQDAVERLEFLPLGGTKLPARAFVTIGLDQAPGIYTCRVTVTDLATKTSKDIEQKFEVLKKSFGLVVVYTSTDPKGEYAVPALGVAGQSVFVHFALVGFGRDTKSKQPNIDVEMIVYAKDNTPTLAKPSNITIDAMVPESENVVPLRFLLPMNRDGDFRVELKATDNVSKATSTVKIPIKVLPAN